MSSIIRDYTHFDSHLYLEEYYRDIVTETYALLKFLVHAFGNLPTIDRALEVGCGPTLYTAIAAAPHVRTLHLSDYLESNLAQIRTWLSQTAPTFDWSDYGQAILAIEGNPIVSTASIESRMVLVRQRVTALHHCDITLSPPVADAAATYDLVISNLCIEAVAQTRKEWQRYMSNLLSLLRPGGYLVLSMVKEAFAYSVGNHVFGVLTLNENDVEICLKANQMRGDTIHISTIPATHPLYPYAGMMCITAQKRH